MNTPRYIIIHCSATPEDRDFTIADIDRWHKAQGWKGCGYHLVVHRDGSYARGRADNEEGAHCPQQSMNRQSVSICYIGGYAADGKTPKDTRTDAQKKTIRTLIATLRGRYGNLPVLGHRDVKGVAKACPCFDAKSEYNS